MIITTKNIDQNIIPCKELREAAKFYASLLMTPKLSEKLKIVIVMKKISDKAYMEWLDNPVMPREFKITLNSRFKKRQTLISLAHEMSHIKQFAKGELRDETTRSPVRWNKRKLNEQRIDYYDLPYEIDARGREEGLYYRFLYAHPHIKVIAR